MANGFLINGSSRNSSGEGDFLDLVCTNYTVGEAGINVNVTANGSANGSAPANGSANFSTNDLRDVCLKMLCSKYSQRTNFSTNATAGPDVVCPPLPNSTLNYTVDFEKLTRCSWQDLGVSLELGPLVTAWQSPRFFHHKLSACDVKNLYTYDFLRCSPLEKLSPGGNASVDGNASAAAVVTTESLVQCPRVIHLDESSTNAFWLNFDALVDDDSPTARYPSVLATTATGPFSRYSYIPNYEGSTVTIGCRRDLPLSSVGATSSPIGRRQEDVVGHNITLQCIAVRSNRNDSAARPEEGANGTSGAWRVIADEVSSEEHGTTNIAACRAWDEEEYWCPELGPVPNGYRRYPSRRPGSVGLLNCNPGWRVRLGNFLVCDKKTKKWRWSLRSLHEHYGNREDLVDLLSDVVQQQEAVSAEARNLTYDEQDEKCELVKNFCSANSTGLLAPMNISAPLPHGVAGAGTGAGYYSFNGTGSWTDKRGQVWDLEVLAADRAIGWR